MSGRASIIDGDPAKVEAGITVVRDRAKPAVEAMPGNRGLSMWVDRVNGLVVVTGSIYIVGAALAQWQDPD